MLPFIFLTVLLSALGIETQANTRISKMEIISGQSNGKVPFHPMDELQNIEQVRLEM